MSEGILPKPDMTPDRLAALDAEAASICTQIGERWHNNLVAVEAMRSRAKKLRANANDLDDEAERLERQAREAMEHMSARLVEIAHAINEIKRTQ